MLSFHLAPTDITLGITHPKGRGWTEAIQEASTTRKPAPARTQTFEEACTFFVGWEKYLPVTEVAVELTAAGWTVRVHNTYTFSAEKGSERFSAETKAKRENDQLVNCWSFSRA
jgi:hypothetical protein